MLLPLRSPIPDFPLAMPVGSDWISAEDDRTFEVMDPATGEILATIPDATPADGMRALDAAARAASSWSVTPARQRSELLARAFEQLIAQRERFAALITLEMGKPLAEARGEVNYGAEFLRWFSEEAVRIDGRFTPNPEGTGTTIVTHRPVGPCLLITPWNFPLAMLTRKIAPALAAGCTVVVKPAELTPLTTLAFVQLLQDVGLPAGVVNVVTTTRSADVCAPILLDPRLRKLSFTGSTRVGSTLLKQAADGILRTSMELGGNAPLLVFEDADLDLALQGVMLAKFRNAGQACTAANRVLVQESVAGEFVSRLAACVSDLRVGHGIEEGVTMGPLIDEKAVRRVEGLVADAMSRGATLVAGGSAVSGPGSFFPPSILTSIPSGTALLTEEIFGPVLPIVTFRSEAEAIALANDTAYGLVGYAFTDNLERVRRLIDQIDTGMMGINTGLVSNASAPFGGTKQSGLGREGGGEGILEYLDTKYTLLANV